MITLPLELLPLIAGALVYAAALALWRCCLSPLREEVEADARANSLLSGLLSEAEREQLDQRGFLTVRSPSFASRIYRIPALTGWIDVYDQGKLSMRLCVQPSEWLPNGDVVLMHKLMIEANEQEYLERANIRWVRAAKEVKMIAKCLGGEAVKGGVYWSMSGGEFVSVPKDGGRLAGGPRDRYVRVPLPLVLLVGPLMGLAFALFLPLSGLLVLVPFLAGKVRAALSSARLSVAHLAGQRLQPGVSYLQPRSGAASEARPSGQEPAEEETESALLDLAKEIAEKRWQEK